MEYAHIDYLIREGVRRRLDLTFDAAVKLRASRVVLHSGFKTEIELFKIQEAWIESNIDFWRREIVRWAEAGIEIVLENDVDKTPDLMKRLVNEVDHRALGLCMDIGHQHVFSNLDAQEWVRRMDNRLFHIHLHDNDGVNDRHWAIGRGTIDFAPFYAAVLQHAPGAVISLEVEDEMDVKMGDLRSLAAYFAAK